MATEIQEKEIVQAFSIEILLDGLVPVSPGLHSVFHYEVRGLFYIGWLIGMIHLCLSESQAMNIHITVFL